MSLESYGNSFVGNTPLSLAAFKILPLSLILGNVIMMCLGVYLLGSKFFGMLWASWTSWKSICFASLGKFSFIICSNNLQFLVLPLLLLAPLWFRGWHVSRCPGGSSASSHFFEFLFLHSVLLECLFHPLVQTVDVSPGFFSVTLGPCRFFFIPLNANLIPTWVFFYAVEAPTELLDHPDNKCFELCIW